MARSLLFSPWPDWDLYSYQQSLTCQLCCHVKWKLPTLHSSYFLWSSSLLTKPNTRLTRIPGRMLCFGYDYNSSKEALYSLANQQLPPRRKKMQASCCELFENAKISDSRRHEGKGLFLPVSHVLPTWGCLMMDFKSVQLGL